MKQLLFAFVALFMVATAYADIGPSNRSVSLDNTGTLQAGSLDQYFIKVKNGSGGDLLDGDVVILDVTADDGYTVTTSTTAGDVPHCILDEACVDGDLCKCQTYGYKSNVNFEVVSAQNATAGNLVFLSESAAGSVMAEAEANYAASDVPVGVFYDAASASGDVEVFIKLR